MGKKVVGITEKGHRYGLRRGKAGRIECYDLGSGNKVDMGRCVSFKFLGEDRKGQVRVGINSKLCRVEPELGDEFETRILEGGTKWVYGPDDED